MQIPLQITFRHMDSSDAMRTIIEEKAKKLDLLYDQIMRCHVIVEVPHQHHHQGRLLQIEILLTLPGEEFVVKRESQIHHDHEDAYVAIHEAFDAAKRKIQNYIQRKRLNVMPKLLPFTDEEVPPDLKA